MHAFRFGGRKHRIYRPGSGGLKSLKPCGFTLGRYLEAEIIAAVLSFKHVVNLLVQLIEDGLRDEYVRRKAVEVVNRAGIRGHDELGEIRAVTKWVQQQVIYRKDPINVEYFHSARRLIKDVEDGRSAADCDDFVIVWGAMLGALGYDVAAVIVDSNGDGMLNHVMGAVKTFAPICHD